MQSLRGNCGTQPTFVISERVSLRVYAYLDRIRTGTSDEFLVALDMPEEAFTKYGAPRQVFVNFEFHDAAIDITFTCWNKTATRLPEALWLSFIPLLPPDASLRLDKLGEWVDPTHVVKNGSAHLHGVQAGVKVPCCRHLFDVSY